MPKFDPSTRPTATPWGPPQSGTQLLNGIWSVETASHGGLMLSDQRQAAMPEALRRSDCHYEEDVDYALVVMAFEAEFLAAYAHGAILVRNARDTVRNWQPDAYAAFTDEEVTARNSHIQRRREAYASRIGKIVVTSAFGEWADWVPAGKTGVFGMNLAWVNHLGHANYTGEAVRALVDAGAYDARVDVISFDELDAVVC